jgi:retron-type reverse transcriptase
MLHILSNRYQTDEDRQLVKIITMIYQNYEFQIGDQHIKPGKGVMQGSIMSPLLFNTVLNAALQDNPLLRSLAKNRSILAYADDVVMVVNSTDEVLEAFGHSIERYGMTINKELSFILTDQLKERHTRDRRS